MTWNVNLGGHKQRDDGTWDEELEKEIADKVRPVVEQLKEYGITTARFSGNHYTENYLDA